MKLSGTPSRARRSRSVSSRIFLLCILLLIGLMAYQGAEHAVRAAWLEPAKGDAGGIITVPEKEPSQGSSYRNDTSQPLLQLSARATNQIPKLNGKTRRPPAPNGKVGSFRASRPFSILMSALFRQSSFLTIDWKSPRMQRADPFWPLISRRYGAISTSPAISADRKSVV